MRTLTALLVSSIVWSGACNKGDDKAQKAKPEATKPDPEAAAKAAKEAAEAAKAAEEAKKKQAEAEEIAKELEKVQTEAAEEAKRWTDDLRKKAAALAAADYKKTDAALKKILASEHRGPGNAARDAHRHPAETLKFFGLEPDMTLVEIGAGEGWYTELLAPLLAKKGKLVVAAYDPEGPKDSGRTVYGIRFKLFLEKSPELFGKVETVYVSPPEKLSLGPDGSANMAIAIREMHGWHRRGYLPQYLASVHAVLEPGGIFGVVQHRAKADANPDESAQKGYLPEAWLIEQVEKAGFELVEKSEINANPKDTKDYPDGVWTLPPAFALGDKDRDKYAAIGESDRMTLKFKKRAP